jgi:hypothetical protein
MKTAIIVCGQPRFIEECFPLMKENVIDPNNADVFAHLWFSEELCTEPYKHGGAGGWKNQRIKNDSIEKFKELYKPISLKVEEPKTFLNSTINFDESLQRYFEGAIDNPEEPDFRFRTIRDNYSAKYSLLKSSILKKTYELENDFKYDYVIKIRTDVISYIKINASDYDPNLVHYKDMNQPDGMISDWLNLSSSKNMDAYASVFNTFEFALQECVKDTGAYCNELLIRKTLDFFGIKIQGHNWPLALPRF